ncbi:uncharacterized protein LOC116205806 isoform X2 [Punica granatum]|nr:uncharacterized protein LOC116205806 isoform X2 [Punica granatum]
MLQERLQVVARQREQMQQMEIEIRSQIIARAGIADIKKSFDAKVHELAKKQFHEKELSEIIDLQRTVEEKDRQLITVKRDNEAKRRQIMELQEQYRVAQETIMSKDEQLREAQEWLSRIQAIDASQLSTLQIELREHAARSREINGLQSPTIQQSELREEMEQQPVLPQISFPMESQRGKTPIHDECLVNPMAENEDREDGLDCNHFGDLGDDGHHLCRDLTYKDITKADVIGMVFDSYEAAENFYKRYALAIGFSVRKQDLRRKTNGVVVMHKWVCNREGRRRQKFLELENRQRKSRPITRVGCPATFQIHMDNAGKWIVKQAILEHNHELASPLDTCFLTDRAHIKREKRSRSS